MTSPTRSEQFAVKIIGEQLSAYFDNLNKVPAKLQRMSKRRRKIAMRRRDVDKAERDVRMVCERMAEALRSGPMCGAEVVLKRVNYASGCADYEIIPSTLEQVALLKKAGLLVVGSEA